MRNIILIGMPGVGKSTLGVILAKIIGYSFIDTDLLIQERTKMLLSEIIAEKGSDGFIAIENEINSSIEAEKTIISTGGSAVYGEKAMRHFKNMGSVVYLSQDLEVIKNRLLDIKGRGIVLRDGQTLDELFAERVLLYEKYADYTVRLGGGSVEENIDLVLKTLRMERPK